MKLNLAVLCIPLGARWALGRPGLRPWGCSDSRFILLTLTLSLSLLVFNAFFIWAPYFQVPPQTFPIFRGSVRHVNRRAILVSRPSTRHPIRPRQSLFASLTPRAPPNTDCASPHRSCLAPFITRPSPCAKGSSAASRHPPASPLPSRSASRRHHHPCCLHNPDDPFQSLVNLFLCHHASPPRRSRLVSTYTLSSLRLPSSSSSL